jgi:hypothetical protein
MPPFLEEGLACMFETITWQGSLPRFNLSVNAMRAETLRKAVEAKDVIPLWELCSMHAGDIVGAKNEKIDAFYAQCWAFARFLWEGEHNRYRPVFQKWLADTADGTVYDPTGSHVRALAPWNRKAVGPMIEHYLGRSLSEVDQSYQSYMKTIAYEELPAHHRS